MRERNGFAELIEALQIFGRYATTTFSPTHCEHDVMYIMDVHRDQVTAAELERLDELGFFWCDEDVEGFRSYRFGSA